VFLSNIQNRFDQLNRFHIILILTVLGLLAYANAVNHPFVHDDVVFIQQNPYLQDLDLKNVFIQTTVPDDKFPLVNQYYRPLLEVVNRVLYRIVGLNPHGFHFFNILLHIANSFLVYCLTRFITDNKKGLSLAAAILFLLHPVQSEAVACISGISNLVFAFLCLMSFYGYLMSVHAKTRETNSAFYIISLVLFFFALLSKEQSVVLPFLIIAYEMCFAPSLFRISRRKCRHIAGFFIVLGGYFLLRKILFGFALTPIADSTGELWLRILAIPRSLLTYLGLMFFPHDLHYYRSQDILLPVVGPLLCLLVVVAAIIGVTCRTPQPQKRWMIFGLGWFMIALLPTLNIVPLINEYSQILTAEHFLYFPLIGMLLFIMGAWHYWIRQRGGAKSLQLACIILGAIGIVFMGATIKQNTYWRGEIPLFERTLRFEKDFGRVHFLLAQAYFNEGRLQDAIAQDRKALAIMQGYARKVENKEIKRFYLGFVGGIHYHLGHCFDVLGDSAGALAQFKKALSLDLENEAFQYAVGLSYLKVNDVDNAIIHFEKTVALNENNLMAVNSLAICYQEVGADTKAERLLRAIVAKDNQSASAKQNLENFLLKKETVQP